MRVAKMGYTQRVTKRTAKVGLPHRGCGCGRSFHRGSWPRFACKPSRSPKNVALIADYGCDSAMGVYGFPVAARRFAHRCRSFYDSEIVLLGCGGEG
jgi:hypothetical protein